MDEQEIEQMIDSLVEDGCFIDRGDTYEVNWPLLEVLHPAVYDVMWEGHIEEVDEALNSLCDMGLLQMGFRVTEEGGMEAIYSLTEDGIAYVGGLGAGGNFDELS